MQTSVIARAWSRPRASIAGRLGIPIALCSLALALRLYRIDHQSLWFDEGISVFHLQRSFLESAAAAAADTHPPLYYWTLKLWASAFGASELAVRSLSALSGAITVGLTWLLGLRLSGTLGAGVAAALLAASPLAVYYGQEARMYALVGALATAAVLCAVSWWRAQGPGWIWLAGYVVLAAASLYTQYLGVLVLAAANLFLLAALAKEPQRLAQWCGAQLLVLVLFLAWLPVFLEQSAERSLNTSPRALPSLVLDTLVALALGRQASTEPLEVAGALAFLVVACGGCAMAVLRRYSPGAIALGVSLALVPTVGVVAMGLQRGLFEVRYLMLALPGLALAAALGMQALWRWGSAGRLAVGFGLVALLAPTALALDRTYHDPAGFRDDYRGAIDHVESNLREGDAVVLDAGNQWEVASYYYRGPAPVYLLPEGRPINLEATRRKLEALSEGHQRAWILWWASRDADPEGFVETWLAGHGFQANHQWYGTLQLALVTFSSPTGAQRTALGLQLDNGAELASYTLGAQTMSPGETVQLTLNWRATRPVPERYKVFTHVVRDGRVVAQRDSEPLGGLRPTPTWRAAEELADNYGIVLPSDLRPGEYRLEVGMYALDSGARAQIVDRAGRAVGDHVVVALITVDARGSRE